MIVRCLGGWTDVTHAPLTIGVKEPLADTRTSDGCCDRCCALMGARIECRWCEDADSANGLCPRCWIHLERRLGMPCVQLTVYRFGAESLSGSYDGAGAILRLRTAMKESNYAGFGLRALVGAP